jgi:hypothetical protein
MPYYNNIYQFHSVGAFSAISALMCQSWFSNITEFVSPMICHPKPFCVVLLQEKLSTNSMILFSKLNYSYELGMPYRNSPKI